MSALALAVLCVAVAINRHVPHPPGITPKARALQTIATDVLFTALLILALWRLS